MAYLIELDKTSQGTNLKSLNERVERGRTVQRKPAKQDHAVLRKKAFQSRLIFGDPLRHLIGFGCVVFAVQNERQGVAVNLHDGKG